MELFNSLYENIEFPIKRVIDISNNLDHLAFDPKRKNTILDILQNSTISILEIIDRHIAKLQELRVNGAEEQEQILILINDIKAISVDIRTPINGIVGFSEILKTREVPPSKTKYYIRNIQVSTALLKDEINLLYAIKTGIFQHNRKNE